MSKNGSLSAAKSAKNNDFFTGLSDIQAELVYYENHFKDKSVLCNCDDFSHSNFVKYFLISFWRLGLKELIVTGFPVDEGVSEVRALRVTRDTSPVLPEGLDLDGAELFLNTHRDELSFCLYGDQNYSAGDFRSDMCVKLLHQADIVTSNPPFDHFKEYVELLVQHKKQFLILGNLNAITYKDFFPLLQDDSVWLGCNNGSKTYEVPSGYAELYPDRVFFQDGRFFTKLGNTGWFTNLDHPKRHQLLPLDLGSMYYCHEADYPIYQNYDAINVDRVSRIPCDYFPCIKVSASLAPFLSSSRFEVVDASFDFSSIKPLPDGRFYAYDTGTSINILAVGHSLEECDAAAEQLVLEAMASGTNICPERVVCNGIMGVPVSFLPQHCPSQFEIVWRAFGNTRASTPAHILDSLGYKKHGKDRGGCGVLNDRPVYSRLLIRRRVK